MSNLSFATRSASGRLALLTSVATLSLAIGGAAQAQSTTGPIATSGGNYTVESQGGGIATAPVSDPNIVIAPPGTSVTDRDPTNVTGVGEMVIDQKNGFIGLCTGTLINPRTVIFAAHCVNESPTGTAQNPWGYGTGAGQLPIAFGFQANNNLAGNSAFGHWLNGTAGGAKYLTSVNEFLYNVNQVQYNPHSLDLGLSSNFLQGDVAIATLDTPAANVPTWALLFSALPAPASISDTTGTGYHVVIDGYGNTGTATGGANVGVDFRRRLAENYLGLLGSLDDIDINLFNIAPRGHPQNLYQIDFDSSGAPNARLSPNDYNLFKDNALPGEGTTGPGDSGGPLILDRTFAKQLVIAVLSGGSRYGPQASGSYGSTAFYQPLYLFWDYIAAANPYRYVGSVAGDGNWTDPTHWVTNVDPAYNVIVNGQLVNGVPTTSGDGINGTAGKFGQICDQEPDFDVDFCVDNSNGNAYDHGVFVGNTGNTPGAPGSNPLPAATLANGLPGATNFVPNNINPNAASQVNGRYFDVTLSAAGTTVLGSSVTIDRLTVNGAAAKLTVNSGASLTSLININQLQGLVTNNGTITTPGDYMLLTGGITGNGRFNAPFFTSVGGMIMPGTAGTIGTITFGGNLVLSSGTFQFIDIGPSGTSDKLAVVANGTSTGVASIGGVVGFAPVAGYTIKAGDTFTILTAAGGISGSYTAAGSFSAILKPTFLYTTNTVQMVVTPGKYADVVSSTSAVQKAYAQLLDQDRGGPATNLPGIYLGLDLQNAATIQATLEGLAPRNQALSDAIGTVALDNMSRFYRDRLASLHGGSLGGTLAVIGKPFQMASLAINGLQGQQAEVRTDAGGEVHEQGKLPERMSGYLAGGYINGHSSPMITALPAGGRDQFDGFYIAGGIETELGAHAVLGVSLSYSKLDGVTVNAPQSARTELIQGSIYAKVETPGGVTLDGIMSGGSLKASTVRIVNVLGTTYTLTGTNSVPAISGEIGLGKMLDAGKLTITPRISARGSHIDLSGFTEAGGGPALRYARTSLDSFQGRAGVLLSGGTTIKPQLSAYYVHEFTSQAGSFGANFVGGTGPNALFALGGRDRNWAEVSGGLTITTGNIDLSVSADTTIGRFDASNQSYRGTIAFHF